MNETLTARRIENLILCLCVVGLMTLAACAVGADQVGAATAPLKQKGVDYLAGLLADGTLTPDLHQALNLALDDLFRQMAEKVAGFSSELSGSKWMEYGGVLLGSILGTSTMSRVRRGVNVVTGKQRLTPPGE